MHLKTLNIHQFVSKESAYRILRCKSLLHLAKKHSRRWFTSAQYSFSESSRAVASLKPEEVLLCWFYFPFIFCLFSCHYCSFNNSEVLTFFSQWSLPLTVLLQAETRGKKATKRIFARIITVFHVGILLLLTFCSCQVFFFSCLQECNHELFPLLDLNAAGIY